jgi:hypothetical protein
MLAQVRCDSPVRGRDIRQPRDARSVANTSLLRSSWATRLPNGSERSGGKRGRRIGRRPNKGGSQAPGTLEVHRADPDFAGWVWALVEVDPVLLSDETEQVDIALPIRLLRRIDACASRHRETRSGFLVRAALGALHRDRSCCCAVMRLVAR